MPEPATMCVLHAEDNPTDADVGYLCNAHYARMRASLLELLAVDVWLRTQLAASSSTALGERVAGSREDPIPLRTDILDLIGPVAPDPSQALIHERGARSLPVLLWEDGRCLGQYDTMAEAAEAMRQAMRECGLSEGMITLLTTRQSRKEVREQTERYDPKLLAAARERWEVQPSERGGFDQAGDPSILDEMRSWAMLVEDDTDDGWPDRRTLTGTIGYLAAHLTWIAGQPWVDEFHREIASLHRRAHHVAPWRAETKRDPNPCTACGTRTIILHLAEGRSVCERRLGGCGRTMTWDHRRDESEVG